MVQEDLYEISARETVFNEWRRTRRSVISNNKSVGGGSGGSGSVLGEAHILMKSSVVSDDSMGDVPYHKIGSRSDS